MNCKGTIISVAFNSEKDPRHWKSKQEKEERTETKNESKKMIAMPYRSIRNIEKITIDITKLFRFLGAPILFLPTVYTPLISYICSLYTIYI